MCSLKNNRLLSKLSNGRGLAILKAAMEKQQPSVSERLRAVLPVPPTSSSRSFIEQQRRKTAAFSVRSAARSIPGAPTAAASVLSLNNNKGKQQPSVSDRLPAILPVPPSAAPGLSLNNNKDAPPDIDTVSALQHNIFESRGLGTGRECGMWHLWPAANILASPLGIIFPDDKGAANVGMKFAAKRVIRPHRELSHSTRYIMWTSHRDDMTDDFWIPNHFVPLLPLHPRNEHLAVVDEEDTGETTQDAPMNLESLFAAAMGENAGELAVLHILATDVDAPAPSVVEEDDIVERTQDAMNLESPFAAAMGENAGELPVLHIPATPAPDADIDVPAPTEPAVDEFYNMTWQDNKDYICQVKQVNSQEDIVLVHFMVQHCPGLFCMDTSGSGTSWENLAYFIHNSRRVSLALDEQRSTRRWQLFSVSDC